MPDNSENYWYKLSMKAYGQVEKDHPITDETPTYTEPDGRVINMSREAMLARVEALRQGVYDTVKYKEW